MEKVKFFLVILEVLFIGAIATSVFFIVIKICRQPNSSIEEATLEMLKIFRFTIKNRIGKSEKDEPEIQEKKG